MIFENSVKKSIIPVEIGKTLSKFKNGLGS